MKKLIIAVAAIAISTSTWAWSAREQGALAGLVIGGVLLSERNTQPAPTVVYTQPQVIIQQPQFNPYAQPICGYNVFCQTSQQLRCIDEATYDQFGRFVSHQRVCSHN